MGYKEIQTPDGRLRLHLTSHYSNAEIHELLPKTQRDANGQAAGLLIAFPKSGELEKDDLIMLELTHSLPESLQRQPEAQRQAFMNTVIAPGLAENVNQLLRDHAIGKDQYHSEFHRQIIQNKPDLAFVDVVAHGNEMTRLEDESYVRKNATGWLMQALGALGAALPWVKWNKTKSKQKRKTKKTDMSRREFLKKSGFGLAILGLVGVTGELMKEKSPIHTAISRDLSQEGPLEGMREAERKFVTMRHVGPTTDLRNPLVASKALTLMAMESQRRGKPVNAKLYFGTGHAAMYEHLTDEATRQRQLQAYRTTAGRYIDPALSHNVVYLRYDPRQNQYVHEVIRMPDLWK